MKLVSFTLANSSDVHFGALLDRDELLDFSSGAIDLPQPATSRGWCELDGEALSAARGLVETVQADAVRRDGLRSDGAVLSCAKVQLQAPVPEPSKVICIGLNYRDHAEESGMEIPERPLVFSKFPTSIAGPGAAVELPAGSSEVDYEAELAVVIGKRAKRVSAAEANNYVLGYACFNDVSARDFQFSDGQWQRGKSCDTFAPIGPTVVTADEVADPHKLRIQLRLNGETLQDSNTDQLIFRIPELIEALSASITLEPGDVIATGTPPGVGFARKPPIYLKAGDRMAVEIAQLGVLVNDVVEPA